MIQPGALGADYSFSRPVAADLYTQGVRFVCRYLAPAPNPKILTPAERDALHAAGIGIVLNWEWYANRPGEGPGAGAADANQAVAQAKDLGYPRGSVIVFSVDFDPTNSQVPNVLAYLQAAESVCLASGYRAGTYGPYSIFDKLVAQRIAVSLLWQPYAWAPRGVGDQDRVQHPSAHVFQRYGLVELTLPGIDENLALKPFDVWLPDTPSPLDPFGEPVALSYLFHLASGDYGYKYPGGSDRVTAEDLPIINETVHEVPKDSNQEYYRTLELAEYDRRMANAWKPVTAPPVNVTLPPFPPMNITLSGTARP